MIVQRWRDYAHLLAWAESEVRTRVLADSDAMSVGAPSRRHETGLEVWFQLPGETTVKPPPRYKMALLIWMVIAPLSLGANAALGPLLGGLPAVAAGYIKAGLIVLVMTYFAMPIARKLLARWLGS